MALRARLLKADQSIRACRVYVLRVRIRRLPRLIVLSAQIMLRRVVGGVVRRTQQHSMATRTPCPPFTEEVQSLCVLNKICDPVYLGLVVGTRVEASQ